MVRARGLVGAATAAAWVLGVWGRGVGTVRRRSSAVAARGRRAAQCPGGATARLRGSAGRGVTKGIVLIRVEPECYQPNPAAADHFGSLPKRSAADHPCSSDFGLGRLCVQLARLMICCVAIWR
jgi:hypothetical protein